tara:strand:+ start:1283 stop:3055 length:1773 start_codon:yes stop_codon:yes gene_type:complete
MKRLSSTDRKALIRLASALPKGSEERKAVLAGLRKSGGHPLGDRGEVNKATASLLKDWVAAGVRDWEKVVRKFYLNDLGRAHDQIHHFERALGRMRNGITDLYADYVQHSDYDEFYDELTDSGFYDLETAIEEADHDLSQMIDKGWADDGYEHKVQEEIEDSILPALERAMDDFKREYGRPPRVASKKMTSSGTVAKTILDQMGGQRRLQMMIGANKFIDLGKGIGIKWPNKQRSKGNYVEIKLTGRDLYDMTFYNVSTRGKKKVKEHRDLYFDMLVPVFEKQTGWYLRMGSKTAASDVNLSKSQMDTLHKDGEVVVKGIKITFDKTAAGYARKSMRGGDYGGAGSSKQLVKDMIANMRRVKTNAERSHAVEQVQHAEAAKSITSQQAKEVMGAIGKTASRTAENWMEDAVKRGSLGKDGSLGRLRFRGGVVNGYSRGGGREFSQRVSSENDFVQAIFDAWETGGVNLVTADMPHPDGPKKVAGPTSFSVFGRGLTKTAGGTDFWEWGRGSDPRKAFSDLQDRARYEHGHGGYSGSIAEKDGYKIRSREKMSTKEAEAFANEDIDNNDKWGPAFAVPSGNGWLFYGIASS